MSAASHAKSNMILAMLLFGTIGIFVHYIHLPSGIIANARGLGGTLFLFLVLKIRGETLHRQAIRQNLRYLIPGGIMLGFNWILLFEAYRYTSVAVATVIYYLAPVFVILLAPLLFREHLTPLRTMSSAVALLGMVLTSGILQGGVRWDLTGVLLALGSAGMYATIVLLNKCLRDIPSYDTTIVQLGVSALVLLPYNLLTVDFSALQPTAVDLLLLLTVSIIHTGVAYTLYFGAIPRLPAQTSAVFSYIDPVSAILLSALLLREPLDLLSGSSSVLVLGSTLTAELLEGRKKAL